MKTYHLLMHESVLDIIESLSDSSLFSGEIAFVSTMAVHNYFKAIWDQVQGLNQACHTVGAKSYYDFMIFATLEIHAISCYFLQKVMSFYDVF
jgi:hypothetical protein